MPFVDGTVVRSVLPFMANGDGGTTSQGRGTTRARTRVYVHDKTGECGDRSAAHPSRRCLGCRGKNGFEWDEGYGCYASMGGMVPSSSTTRRRTLGRLEKALTLSPMGRLARVGLLCAGQFFMVEAEPHRLYMALDDECILDPHNWRDGTGLVSDKGANGNEVKGPVVVRGFDRWATIAFSERGKHARRKPDGDTTMFLFWDRHEHRLASTSLSSMEGMLRSMGWGEAGAGMGDGRSLAHEFLRRFVPYGAGAFLADRSSGGRTDLFSVAPHIPSPPHEEHKTQ
jgi:hypothetical protein